MKNCFVYENVDVKRFKHVTVVEGRAYPKENPIEELNFKLFNLCNAINSMSSSCFKIEGRSKCSPDDIYNEKTGFVVASRKAELKANKIYLREVTEARKEAESILNMLKDMEDKLDFKTNRLELNLVALNKGE